MREYVILRYSSTDLAILAEVVPRSGSITQPADGFGVTLGDSLPVIVRGTEVMLGVGVSVLCSFAIPVSSLDIVLGDPLAVFVGITKAILGAWVSLLRRLAIPANRFSVVLGNIDAPFVRFAEPGLGTIVVLIGQFAHPVDPFARINESAVQPRVACEIRHCEIPLGTNVPFLGSPMSFREPVRWFRNQWLYQHGRIPKTPSDEAGSYFR